VTKPKREENQMSETSHKKLAPRSVAVTALALGLVGGGYGIVNAASGSSAFTTASSTSSHLSAAPSAASAPSAQKPWGGQRSDETLLTGDALAKVTALAKAKVSGGTIVRVETDADGHAAYEAHMTDASGAPVTVYVDKQFNVVSVETRQPGPPQAAA
jgi:hypothetical protein